MAPSDRKDYLMVNPFLHPPGGGEGVANWMIEVLSRRGRVTVLTWEPPDFRKIDVYYGTSLASKQTVRSVVVAPRLRALLERFNVPHHLLKSALLNWKARRMRSSHGLCFCAFNEMALGPPAVQYIHHPTPFDDGTQDLPGCPWPDRAYARWLWPIYIRFVRSLLSRDLGSIRGNITLANSRWTGQHYRRIYGGPVHRVIYPPPLSVFKGNATSRTKSFLSVARIDRSKEWPKLIEIVAAVRARGHMDLRLTLAGSRYDAGLLVELEALAAAHPDWLSLQLDCSREELDGLIASHRYGIHGMVDEHYGMAIAELVLGGCLTFVHDSGGQVEIVPQDEVRYRNVDDAVNKISAVLEDFELESRLREAQLAQSAHLTREAFVDSMDTLVDELEQGLTLSPVLPV